jgi:eukaryotic-like serine/threonine-protein kinase
MNTTAKRSHDANKHLSPPELRLLLSDDDASDEFRAAAQHLEFCETCQSHLTTIAGDPESWHDAQSLLDANDQPRWEPDLSQSLVSTNGRAPDRESINEHLLKLLGTPKHPEMLGRLGRYDIEQIIGSGGMGIVLKAHDTGLNRPIAIKLLAPHLSHVGAARERFAREGRAAAAVVHEHVVAIYNVEADGTLPFLIMQYVPGRSLQARVDEDGPLAVEEILRIGLQAAAGLAAAHAQGLVHRDVKPSNILLEDTVERAVLTDFGLARAMDDASLTQTGILAGTPHYMSPEQATGEEIDARSDLFSLGAVLYFMATGHPPFRAAGALAVLHRICREEHRPVWQWNKAVPDELSDLIDRLLEKKPGRRFSSAEDVRQKLASLLSHVQQHGVGRRRFSGWRSKRGRRKVWSALAALSAATVVAGLFTWIAAGWPGSTGPSPSSTALDAGAVTQGETEFFKTLDEIQNSMNGAASESVYLRSGDESWLREIESLERDLDKVELNDR